MPIMNYIQILVSTTTATGGVITIYGNHAGDQRHWVKYPTKYATIAILGSSRSDELHATSIATIIVVLELQVQVAEQDPPY